MKIVIIIFLLFSNPILGQKRIQFPPIKDSITDNSLQIFIDTLKEIILRKDKKIYTLISTKIINGFEVNIDGIKYFKTIWAPLNKSELWNVLHKIMFFGGQYYTAFDSNTKDATTYIYPYFFDKQIEGEKNYYELNVVDGENINIVEAPKENSNIILRCTYEVVRQSESTNHLNKNGWYFVQTLDNKYKGYIKGTQMYNFSDYRMTIRKQKGTWKITSLVSGG